jgi:hypothetical protein
MTERATVKNADDREQVTAGRERIQRKEEILTLNIRRSLDVPAARDVLWAILTECGVFATPFNPDDRLTHANIGRGDIGRWLVGEIAKAKPTALAEMMLAAQRDEEH